MPSRRDSDADYLVRLYGSPDKLRDALRECAIQYLACKDAAPKAEISSAQETERKRSALPAFDETCTPVQGDGFFMAERPNRRPARADMPIKAQGNGLKAMFGIVSFLRRWILPGTSSSPQADPARESYVSRGASKRTYELLLAAEVHRFHEAVLCLAGHKNSGWYKTVGDDVVAAIDQAYADHGNDPLKALDAVAPTLAKLEASPAPAPPRRTGPLLG